MVSVWRTDQSDVYGCRWLGNIEGCHIGRLTMVYQRRGPWRFQLFRDAYGWQLRMFRFAFWI